MKAVRQDLCGVLEEKRTLIETLGSLKGDVSSSADALKRQEEIAAAREREERVDLLRRQMVRRIMNRDVAFGFGAWAELWQSRVYALTRLREGVEPVAEHLLFVNERLNQLKPQWKNGREHGDRPRAVEPGRERRGVLAERRVVLVMWK